MVNRSADEKAIAKLLEDIVAAFNRHDAKAVVSLYASDATARQPDGQVLEGRAAMEKYLSEQFMGRFRKAEATSARSFKFRDLTDDPRLADGFIEMSGLTGPNGLEMPPVTFLSTVIIVKRTNKWQVLTARTYPANAVPGPAVTTT